MRNKSFYNATIASLVLIATVFSYAKYCYAESAPDFLREIPENTLTLNSPWGIATDDNSDYFYITDTSNNRVIQFSTKGNGIESSWGGLGTGEGAFNAPKGIVLDGMDNVYVVDTGNDRVQKFNQNGSQFILQWGESGTGNGKFDSPSGIAVDSYGDLFVVDSENNRVQKFDSNGNYLAQFGSVGSGEGEFITPNGIDIDQDDNIYVVDTGNNRVQKFDSSGSYLGEIGSSGTGDGQFDMPVDIEIIEDSGTMQIFVSDFDNNRVQEFLDDGSYLDQFGTEGVSDGEFYGPAGMVFTSDGYLNVVDLGSGRIQSFSAYDYEFYRATHGYWYEEGLFYNPKGLGLSKNGDLYIYVADTDNDRVQKFYGGGDFIATWGSHGKGNGEFDKPVDVAVSTAGDAYVVDRDNHRIQELASDGTFKRQWGSEGSGESEFLDPTGIAINSVSDVYIADAGNDRIQKFSLEGTFIMEWGSTGSGNGEFSNPTKVAISPDDVVYVADTDNDRIQYFTSDGEFLGEFGISGDGPGEFNSPQGIDIDDAGNIYVSDTDNHRIQKFDSNHTFVYEFGSPGAPLNYFGMLGSSISANNHGPLDISVDAEGNLYVLDGINNRIQVFGVDTQDEGEIKQDLRCHFTKPEETTWIKLEPIEKEGVPGMYLTWTQYSATTVNIKIDDGTGSYPWMISNTSNDGHEFLPNVSSWQNIKIQPINHCSKGNYSVPISNLNYPFGWYNLE